MDFRASVADSVGAEAFWKGLDAGGKNFLTPELTPTSFAVISEELGLIGAAVLY